MVVLAKRYGHVDVGRRRGGEALRRLNILLMPSCCAGDVVLNPFYGGVCG